jgi:hypothetical protein
MVVNKYLQPQKRGKEEEKMMMMAVLYSQNYKNKVLCNDRLSYSINSGEGNTTPHSTHLRR